MKSTRLLGAIVSTIILIFVSYFFIHTFTTAYSTIKDRVIYGYIGSLATINPLNRQDELSVLLSKTIFRPLISFDDSYQPIGDIAETWTVSEDQKTFTFKIAPNQTWQDGQTLDANDVYFTFDRIKNSPEYLNSFPFMNSVQLSLIDDETISFTLNDVYSPFVSLLNIEILPKHIWENIAFDQLDTNQYNLLPVGSGNYSVISYKQGSDQPSQLLLKANQESMTPAELLIKFYPNQDSMITAFKLGDIDAFFTMNQTLSNTFKDYKNVQIQYTSLCGETISLFFNLSNKDRPTNLLDFRNNISHLLQATSQYSFTSNLPTTDWANGTNLTVSTTQDRDFQLYANQINEALQGTALNIIASNDLITTNVATTVQSLLTDYQISYEFQYKTRAELETEIIPNRGFDILIIPQKFSKDPDQYTFWHSTQTDTVNGGLNISGYIDRRMDRALEVARKTFDLEDRKNQYAIIEERIRTDKPAIFIAFPSVVTIIRTHQPKITLSSCIWDITEYFQGL